MKKKLNEFKNDISSQFGEDGIINEIFKILPAQDERWCVEFGAWDGKFLSNTYELIQNHAWKGVLIEGNKKKFPDLINTFGSNKNAVLINKLIHFSGQNTLDNILKETSIPLDFDLLSIDIDGNDYHIWESLNSYQPKLIIIEFNPSIPSDIEYVQKKDFSLNQGNSLLSLIKLGKSKGYELVATTHCNGFFIKKEFYNLFEIPDNSIKKLWDTETVAPRIFQLFDGTLVLSEGFKLNWTNSHVKELDLQKLPPLLRHYSDSPNAQSFLKKIRIRLHRLFLSKTYN